MYPFRSQKFSFSVELESDQLVVIANRMDAALKLASGPREATREEVRLWIRTVIAAAVAALRAESIESTPEPLPGDGESPLEH